MTIDKQQLQKLLWAEAASFRADCANWKRNTEALDEFLGEKTVGEVALELLAENEELRKFGEEFAVLAERRREEADALRNAHADAERYRYLRNRCGLVEYKAITGSIGPGMLPSGAKLDVAIDAAMGRGGAVMIDMNEVLDLQRKGDFAELTRRGIQISDGKMEQAEGWAKPCFSGFRAHYFVQVSANAIGPGGRYRSWKSECGAETTTHDKAPMFGMGNWERCKACLKKRNAKRSLEATPVTHMSGGDR